MPCRPARGATPDRSGGHTRVRGVRVTTGKPGVPQGRFTIRRRSSHPQMGWSAAEPGITAPAQAQRRAGRGPRPQVSGGGRAPGPRRPVEGSAGAGRRDGLGDDRGGRRAGMGDGEEYGVAPGGVGGGPSEAAREVASLSDPELSRSTEKSPMELSGEGRPEGPVTELTAAAGGETFSRGAAAGRAGPGRVGAGPGPGGRRLRGARGPGGSPLGPAGQGVGREPARSSSAMLARSRM